MNAVLLDGVRLEEVQCYKYLGVKIDSDHNFKTHVNGIIKNVASKVHNNCKKWKCLTRKAILNVYKAMVVPLYDIGDVVYACTNMPCLKKLQTIQNIGIRVIYNLPSTHNTDQLHEKLKLLKLEDRRKLHLNQLAHWMAQQDRFIDERALPTRAHVEGRKMLELERPK